MSGAPSRFLHLVVALAFLCGCQSENGGLVDDTPPLPDFDFTEVVPPSTLYPPGTVVAIRRVDPNTSLDIVCDRESAAGPSLPVASSPGIEASARRRASGSFTLDLTVLKLITGNAALAGVREVTYSLRNLRFEELAGNNAVAAERNRSADCTTSIDRALAEGKPVTMVKTVLIADVTYTINFDTSANLSAAAKQGLIDELSGALSATATNAGSNTLAGNALIWGIRDNKNYVRPTSLGFGPNDIPDEPLLETGDNDRVLAVPASQ